MGSRWEEFSPCMESDLDCLFPMLIAHPKRNSSKLELAICITSIFSIWRCPYPKRRTTEIFHCATQTGTARSTVMLKLALTGSSLQKPLIILPLITCSDQSYQNCNSWLHISQSQGLQLFLSKIKFTFNCDNQARWLYRCFVASKCSDPLNRPSARDSTLLHIHYVSGPDLKCRHVKELEQGQ